MNLFDPSKTMSLPGNFYGLVVAITTFLIANPKDVEGALTRCPASYVCYKVTMIVQSRTLSPLRSCLLMLLFLLLRHTIV